MKKKRNSASSTSVKLASAFGPPPDFYTTERIEKLINECELPKGCSWKNTPSPQKIKMIINREGKRLEKNLRDKIPIAIRRQINAELIFNKIFKNDDINITSALTKKEQATLRKWATDIGNILKIPAVRRIKPLVAQLEVLKIFFLERSNDLKQATKNPYEKMRIDVVIHLHKYLMSLIKIDDVRYGRQGSYTMEEVNALIADILCFPSSKAVKNIIFHHRKPK